MFSRSIFFTPRTAWSFFVRTLSEAVSFTVTVKLPWKSPSTESILMERSMTPDSLLITDVMLVTMPRSSLPTMWSVTA